MRIVISVLFFLFSLCGYTHAKDSEVDRLLQFTKGFKVEFDYSIDESATNAQINESSRFKRVNYKSTEPFTVDQSGKWFMRFSLDIISYKTPTEARSALAELRERSRQVAAISKCQDYIVQRDSVVYWIAAPCNFWDIGQLEKAFNKTMMIREESVANAIRCRNGGFCR